MYIIGHIIFVVSTNVLLCIYIRIYYIQCKIMVHYVVYSFTFFGYTDTMVIKQLLLYGCATT